MNKYTWETSENSEIWQHDTFDTMQDCIADAIENYGVITGDTIYIGECVSFDCEINADSVLEQLEQDAYDFAGELAEGWEAYDRKSHAEVQGVQELSDSLTTVVKAWLKKYNREPSFYQVDNIEAVEITDTAVAKQKENENG